MKSIAFVISSFGNGHLTRQIAIVKRLSNTYSIRMIMDEKLINKAKFLLKSDNITYYQIPFVPFINMSTPELVDAESSIDSYQRSWDFDTQLRDDSEWGRILQGVSLIINDIESLHNPIAHKMNIKILNISNFTWSDILENLGAPELAKDYRTWESIAEYSIKLSMSTQCSSFNNPKLIGLIANLPSTNNIIKQNNAIFIGELNGYLKNHISKLLTMLINDGFTPIVKKKYGIDGCIVYDWETPNIIDLIQRANISIIKCGYSTVSECFTTGTYMLHWKREMMHEDDMISEEIVKSNFGELILNNADLNNIYHMIKDAKLKLDKNPISPKMNNTEQVCEYINEIINN